MIPHSRPSIAPSDIAAVASTLKEGMIGEGERTAELERTIAAAHGVAGAVACGSGCQALWLALGALGIGSGDEVILPGYLCPEVSETIRRIGASPVAVDVGTDWHLDADRAARGKTSRSAAVIAPRLFGHARDFSDLRRLGLPIIEDWAQFAHPEPQRLAPTVGDIVFLSFEATKVLTAGEGGLAFTTDLRLLARMRRAKRIGATAVRFNLTPLSDLQAALAVAQWRRLPAMLARRRILAGRYLHAIQDLPGIVAPSDDFLSRATHFRLPLRLDLRSMAEGDRMMARFAAAGVAVRRPVAALLAPARAVPTAARLLRQTLSLPLYPALSDADQGKVIAAARSILAGRQPFDGA